MTSWHWSPIIALDSILKIWIELIKSTNDNVTNKFYRVRVFSKVEKKGAPALRVIRAGTRLTVHRSLPVGKPRPKGTATF